MTKRLLRTMAMMVLMALTLSGCIIVDEGWYGHHHRGYHDGYGRGYDRGYGYRR